MSGVRCRAVLAGAVWPLKEASARFYFWIVCDAPAQYGKGGTGHRSCRRCPPPLREAVSVRCKVEVEVGSPERDVPPLREAVSVRCKVEVGVGSPEWDVPPLREAVSVRCKVEVEVGSPEWDVPPLQRAASARRKVEVETQRAFGVRPGE